MLLDHAALETLSQRGITKGERKSMRELVKWNESNQAQPLATHAQSPREAALIAVYDWVQDWTDCARTVITRRDQLIRLGIGKRRSRKQDVAPSPTPSPVILPSYLRTTPHRPIRTSFRWRAPHSCPRRRTA